MAESKNNHLLIHERAVWTRSGAEGLSLLRAAPAESALLFTRGGLQGTPSRSCEGSCLSEMVSSLSVKPSESLRPH